MVCRSARRLLSEYCSTIPVGGLRLSGRPPLGGRRRGGGPPVDGLLKPGLVFEATSGTLHHPPPVRSIAVLTIIGALLGPGDVAIVVGVAVCILLCALIALLLLTIAARVRTNAVRTHRRRRPSPPRLGVAFAVGAGPTLGQPHCRAPREAQRGPRGRDTIQRSFPTLQGTDHPYGLWELRSFAASLAILFGETDFVLRNIDVHGLRVHGDAPNVATGRIDDSVPLRE
mmetsp:Transcript_26109/g.65753  ORF Transcript_26109/g.65753 Transcript_26109/m.65753 type:complete len:228 (-) Transcript_26109:164-847(-)